MSEKRALVMLILTTLLCLLTGILIGINLMTIKKVTVIDTQRDYIISCYEEIR